MQAYNLIAQYYPNAQLVNATQNYFNGQADFNLSYGSNPQGYGYIIVYKDSSGNTVEITPAEVGAAVTVNNGVLTLSQSAATALTNSNSAAGSVPISASINSIIVAGPASVTYNSPTVINPVTGVTVPGSMSPGIVGAGAASGSQTGAGNSGGGAGGSVTSSGAATGGTFGSVSVPADFGAIPPGGWPAGTVVQHYTVQANGDIVDNNTGKVVGNQGATPAATTTTNNTGGNQTTTGAPTIASLSVSHAAAGTTVTITGTNFNTTSANFNVVQFASGTTYQNASATAVNSSGTSLTFTVPAGLAPGAYTVRVINVASESSSAASNFTVDSSSAAIGQSATLTLSQSTITLPPGTMQNVQFGLTTTLPAEQAITVTSSNSAVATATADANGGVIHITGVSAGTAVITVHPTVMGTNTSQDKTITVTVGSVINSVTTLNFSTNAAGWNQSSNTLTLAVGAAQQIKVTSTIKGAVSNSVTAVTQANNIVINDTAGVITVMAISASTTPAVITVQAADGTTANILVLVIAAGSSTTQTNNGSLLTAAQAAAYPELLLWVIF